MLDYHTVKRAYAILTPVYDILFNKIFHSGRVAAIDLLEIKPGDRVLEIGIGTGLNLPLYPHDCSVTGIDISGEMLQKARVRAKDLGLTGVTLGVMDASNLEFPDSTFDHVLATYVISAVPDPVKTLLEMRRVCKPSGHLVILNHFRSENPILGAVEWMLAPVCTRIGFKTDLRLKPLLEKAALSPDQIHRINVMMMNGWRLVRCVKPQ
jgi:phosphatidylethanolamine/phosphatidyl-N-methylethanolamine N-methyltransferase